MRLWTNSINPLPSVAARNLHSGLTANYRAATGGSEAYCAFFRSLLFLAVAALPALAQIAPGDWPNYSRDLAGTKYSPLDQITPGNVAKLAPAWTFSMRSDAPRAGGAADPFATPGATSGANSASTSAATPIVVHGVMYLPVGTRVVALDPVTGAEIWSYALPT